MPVNARDLFEAIGMVDEDLVEEADGPVRRPAWTPRRVMGRVLPVAACLCIVGAAVLSFGRGMFSAGSSEERTSPLRICWGSSSGAASWRTWAK